MSAQTKPEYTAKVTIFLASRRLATDPAAMQRFLFRSWNDRLRITNRIGVSDSTILEAIEKSL